MTFFLRHGVWRSLLDMAGVGDETTKNDRNESLNAAATASRDLNSEDNIRPSVHGVLAIKIRMASLIKFEKNVTHMNGGCYCVISIRNLSKRTQVSQNNAGILKWEQLKHFPVQIVRNRRHPYNMLRIQLFGFSPNSTTDIMELGSVSFHLHDIIKANPIAGTYDLWNSHMQIGDIDLEFTHSYGRFGYGYSPQLKEDDVSPEEIVTYSLFPRVIPERSKLEREDPVILVNATPHPQYLKLKEPAYLSYGKEIRDALDLDASEMYHPSMFEKEMSAFEKVRDEYFSSSDRFARLTFLRNYLKGSTNQEEITIGLQDDTNLEGDTQHRVLVSKDYTRFVTAVASSNAEPSVSNLDIDLPILVSPVDIPQVVQKSALKAVADTRKEYMKRHQSTYEGPEQVEFIETVMDGPSALEIPGSW